MADSDRIGRMTFETELGDIVITLPAELCDVNGTCAIEHSIKAVLFARNVKFRNQDK